VSLVFRFALVTTLTVCLGSRAAADVHDPSVEAPGLEPEPPPDARPVRDSDEDGLPDAVERATGTSPIDVDSDDDSVADGDEDVDLDGRVDPGESDPRRPGLFPGVQPHLPEPLSFDLVRGLGAREGELETNVLVTLRPGRGGLGSTSWAPEVEWAVRDGLAFELEVPMVDRSVHALKAAAQWSAPGPIPNMAQGVQTIAEHILDDGVTKLTALYLLGGRIGSVSVFTMTGLRGAARAQHGTSFLFNPSVFVDLDEAVTIGVEGQSAFPVHGLASGGGRSGAAIAQLHWQAVRRFRVQLGAGIEVEDGRPGSVIVSRWILE